jgi:hypothetical protein
MYEALDKRTRTLARWYSGIISLADWYVGSVLGSISGLVYLFFGITTRLILHRGFVQ